MGTEEFLLLPFNEVRRILSGRASLRHFWGERRNKPAGPNFAYSWTDNAIRVQDVNDSCENLKYNQPPRGSPNGESPCSRTDYDSYKPARSQESILSVTEFAVKHVYSIVYNVASGRQSMTQGVWYDAAATCVISRLIMSAGVGGQSDVVVSCVGEEGKCIQNFCWTIWRAGSQGRQRNRRESKVERRLKGTNSFFSIIHGMPGKLKPRWYRINGGGDRFEGNNV